MDLIGHLGVIEAAGLATGDELWGNEVHLAFFPNLAHCHDWAYRELWRDPQELGRADRLIQAHMICDYVIHYGPDLVSTPERIGWAYVEAPHALAQLDRFVDGAKTRDLLESDPRDTPNVERMRRDFSHTAAECALDLTLAERFGPSSRLATLQPALRRFADEAEFRRMIDGTFATVGGETKEPWSVLWRTAQEYAQWSTWVTSTTEYAALTLCSKFHLAQNRDSVEYVVEFLQDLTRHFDKDAMPRLVDDIVARIDRPSLAMSA